MTRLHLFCNALLQCNDFLLSHPDRQVYLMIIRQLVFLITIEVDPAADRERLLKVCLGTLIAHEVLEDGDEDLAQLLSQVDDEVRMMLMENN